jgi:hypothetical protein
MRYLFLTLPVLGLLACGGLDANPNDKAPLATIVGELSNPGNLMASSASNVRIALLWGRESDDFGNFQASTDLPVQPVFPSRFQIALRDAPPAAMMYNPFEKRSAGSGGELPDDPPIAKGQPMPDQGGGGGVPGGTAPPAPMGLQPQNHNDTPDPQLVNLRVALATVVAYEDRNGNRRIDPVEYDATGFVDRIVAANRNLLVVYFDGAVPASDRLRDGNGQLPKSGYNVYRAAKAECANSTDEKPIAGPSGGSSGSNGTSGGAPALPVLPEECNAAPSEWLPMSTLFELKLTDSPEINQWMCKNGKAGDSPSVTLPPGVPQMGRPAQYPSPTDPKLKCNSGGAGYSYGLDPVCTTVYRGVCIGNETTCVGGDEVIELWRRPDPVPVDWPCK